MALIGMLLNLTEKDRETPRRMDAFQKGLGATGAEIKPLYGDGGYDTFRSKAQQLVLLNPTVLFGTCGPSTWALEWARQDAKRNDIPIVFTAIFDPADTARTVPANATGVISWQFTRCELFVDLLK